MSYSKRNNFIKKKFTKTAAWKLIPDPFVFVKNYLENEIFEAIYLY